MKMRFIDWLIITLVCCLLGQFVIGCQTIIGAVDGGIKDLRAGVAYVDRQMNPDEQ